MAAEVPPTKYERIASDLRSGIRGGEYAPGAQLPSKANLRMSYGVSDGPVNRAFEVLRREGLAETRQGAGAFVCDPLPDVALSEYETVISRIEALEEVVRQLNERFERQQAAES